MEEEEEINKEEEEGDDEDEEEEDDGKSSAIDDQTTQGSLEMVEPVENKQFEKSSPERFRRRLISGKNFKPRSIVFETIQKTESGLTVEDDQSAEEKSVKNRRKRSKTPLRLLKTEVIDLSLRESREDSDSDVSENSKQTVNLKNVPPY